MPQQTVTVYVSNLPIGSIVAHTAPTIPSGWLACDGSTVDAALYPQLAAQMQHTPNFSGRTLIGAGNTYGQGFGANSFSVGETGGEPTHLLTVEEMPAHHHELNLYEGDRNWSGGTGNSYWGNDSNHTLTKSTNNKGGNRPHNNMQPYYVVNYIIYAGS